MPHELQSRVSAALASLAAGPIFAVSTVSAAFHLELPKAIEVDPAHIAPLLMLIVPVVLVGFVLSIVPNMVASRLLYLTGVLYPKARAPFIWVAAGAALGTLVAWLFTDFAEPSFSFGLITTSACCAAICRHSAFWD